ncbi:glycosyl hydrolase [Chitinophagaceae bacterium LB-8]|uniref:Glycosyl hydrolase n=1 Tax=Paraflavisolibacter caeni TaxID=2982496 RepID=A0A9X2XY72_9BACT|nr:glycoside hydrolase family 30 protein [Paraflavisolibacter caeni]MCU7549813.1 glycosyl hydrolase [Paraflavisolibacter caeni]
MKKLILIFSSTFFMCALQAQQKSSGKLQSMKFKSLENKKVTVYTTAQCTEQRISQSESLEFKDFAQPLETDVCVFVDPTKTFQTVVGIGGAITDAAAETFAKLPKESQQEFLKAYYDLKDGIGYTLGRTNINSCDFSSGSYTYVADGDKELKTFSIAHDQQYRIPMIKQAMAAAGGRLNLFASPWSPPAWMKDNNNMLQGGKLLPQYRQTWANYYVQFIKAYEKEGVPVWGLSVQNEPMAKQRWESCIFTAEDERDFIKQYLGPTLQKQGMGGKKLIAWDHNRDLMYQRARVVLDDPDAAKFVWGIGFHWYETWTGGPMQFENVKRVHETFPDKNLIFTEGCIEKFSLERINDWALGEKYGRSLVNDFNNGTVAWCDWNILLDEKGGPNHVGNYCFAPIHADTRTGKLMYTSEYYYLGHFSKFVRPGAKRIVSLSNRDQLLTTAFINQDGKVAIVVMNPTGNKISYKLCLEGKGAEAISLPHSISTILIQ